MNTYLLLDAHGFVVERMRSSGDCPPPGWVTFRGRGDPVRLRSDGQWMCAAPRPSELHQLDRDTGTWTLNTELAWAAVRAERDHRIAATDWRVVRAQEAGEALDPAWQAYRQALRDITAQPDPEKIQWPEPPKGSP